MKSKAVTFLRESIFVRAIVVLVAIYVLISVILFVKYAPYSLVSETELQNLYHDVNGVWKLDDWANDSEYVKFDDGFVTFVHRYGTDSQSIFHAGKDVIYRKWIDDDGSTYFRFYRDSVNYKDLRTYAIAELSSDKQRLIFQSNQNAIPEDHPSKFQVDRDEYIRVSENDQELFKDIEVQQVMPDFSDHSLREYMDAFSVLD